ncbi:MAG: AsnC family transcriptional regulator [Candidatus Nitrosopolaris sp.]
MDNIDLHIIRLLARDCRTPYSNIASAVGITPSAAKERITKMISKVVIRSFVVVINPVIFGYEKECFLMLKNIDKTIKEQDIFKKLSLLGDIIVYAKQLERAAMFVLSVRTGTEEKIGVLTDLLKPAAVESIFGSYKPVAIRIHSSDLEIMKCLLSDPRMPIEDIAKETSLSTKTVARRLEKLTENHVLQFTIVVDLSSLQLTGYIEFAALINVHASSHHDVVERMYREMEEYLLRPHSYQKELGITCFLCANISSVNFILKRLESYDGVKKVESFITTSLTVYQDWLKREIDKRLISQKVSPTATASTTGKEA